MYYNTTNQRGRPLEESQTKTETQEDRVLKIFKLVSDRPMGPNIVMRMYNNHFTSTPITSIRRAITNLTIKGSLVKHDAMEMGGYGKLEHTWKLPADE
jgi:hypothetical protein